MRLISKLRIFFLVCCGLFMTTLGFSQGLEDIIVETYYISDANDATDTDGGGDLVAGATTYRIYVDMAPGYEIQAVFGNANHSMTMSTTTEWFNNEDRGEQTGDAIGLNRFDDNTVALDSYLALGAPTDGTLGVLKTEDTNGAVANGDGFLQNNDPLAGIPINTQDGMIPGTLPSGVLTVGLDASMFADANDVTDFVANSGAWSVLEGVTGPTATNRVLIAQITTDGEFEFHLNIQLGTPDGASTEQYVAEAHPNDTDEQVFAALNFNSNAVPGCTDATACNYNENATSNDSSCVYASGCDTCSGEIDGTGAVMDNDADNDGVCDVDEIVGCQDASACNYNSAATDPDTCAFASGCDSCSGETDGTGVVVDGDADDDGVCNVDEIEGCKDASACNYNIAATDPGSCEFASGCDVCSGENDGSGTVVDGDSDDDGVCDVDEVAGCTDASADNYDPLATDEDGSCTYGAAIACDGLEGGLEDVIVETYYIADANDATDTDGGGDLVEGAVTYRIYADLAPGYEIQAVFGNSNHPMSIATTTEFFNNEDRGEETGDAIALNRFDDNTVALDSYLALGAPTDATLGVLKTEDTDGAIANSDGFLQNNDAAAGIPISTQDGMIPGVLPSGLLTVGLDASMFADLNSSVPFFANGGAWSVLEGVTGPTAENRVLIAQITTDGDLSFELNIQLGTPDGVSTEQYVAVADPADSDERQCNQLIFPQPIEGCIDATACNYDAGADTDDSSCIYATGCDSCSGETDGTGVVVDGDSDDDGVCDLDEVVGCQDNTACNYNAAATDAGSCIFPAGCETCSGETDGTGIIVDNDADDDSVCDADEIPGCTNSVACNYNPSATDDDASCMIPELNCTQCNGMILEIIDTDGDGICDAQEDPGCTSPTACNYDASATNDDGTCLEPETDCTQCNGMVLEIIDTDGDGICDADEIDGCASPTACNYDPTATDDDGSCNEPDPLCSECVLGNPIPVPFDLNGNGIADCDEAGCNDPNACNYEPTDPGVADCIIPVPDCSECNEIYAGGFELVIIDTDGDGICDADEIPGCMSPEACNYDPSATDDDPTLCVEPTPNCTECFFDGSVWTLIPVDTDGDGVCDADEVPGCTDASACNYNPVATDDNGSCFLPVADCLECGPNGSIILIDTDGDGVCDAEEIPGCMKESACNYNSDATDDDGSCLEPIDDCFICNGSGDGLIILDDDGDGICNAYEIDGCQSPSACNYNPDATDDDGSCIEPTPDCLECYYTGSIWVLITIDSDSDGICDADEVPGCTNPAACNYDPSATDEDGSCIVPVADCSVCNSTNDGLDIVDTDGDGVCDADEVDGCTSPTACNYDPAATEEDGSCLEPVDDCLVCYYDGMHWQLVLVDSDGDGVCDADDVCFGDDATGDPDGDGICADEEIFGCTDPAACNYDTAATEDDWSCVIPVADCLACNSTNDGLVLVDDDGDGVCNANEIDGCTSATACNYDPAATDDDGSCIEPVADCLECNSTQDGLVIVDTDGDGVCDADEVPGCTSLIACNYNPLATEEDGSCLVPLADCLECNSDNTGLILIDSDGDGVCDANEVDGCTSPSACNYDPAATDDDGSCIEPIADCQECDPITQTLVIIDTDGDGICDADEVPGCADPAACNYDSAATDDDGSCVIPVPDCTECYSTWSGLTVLILIDEDGDGICNADEVPGCTNPAASNYDPLATDDDGSCVLACIDVPTCESFEVGFNGWTNSNDDDIDWTHYSGATPSYYTGPSSAVDGHYYVYIEASYPNYPGKNAQLISNCYDLSVSSSVSFAYHMQGVYNAVGSLSVDISADDGVNWTTIWSASGHQGVSWNEAVVDISAYTGETVRFRLNGTTAYSWKGDIAVDQFCVVESVLGCTDPTAGNYNPDATVDDGSCTSFTCTETVGLPYCMGFEAGIGNWIQSESDSFDWVVNSGGTASWGTGPSGASEGSNYLYIESSYPNYPFKTATVMTSCLDLTGATSPEVAFDYHMYGTYVGAIYLQASTDGVNWDYIWWENGSQGDQWLSTSVDLTSYVGNVIQLRFTGQTAHGWQGDMAIDNVCVDETIMPTPISFTEDELDYIHEMITKEYVGSEELQSPEFAQLSMRVYPNPVTVSGQLNVEISEIATESTVIMVTIRDLVGKEVVATQYSNFGSSMYEAIELPSHIATGTYLVIVNDGVNQISERIVITK